MLAGAEAKAWASSERGRGQVKCKRQLGMDSGFCSSAVRPPVQFQGDGLQCPKWRHTRIEWRTRLTQTGGKGGTVVRAKDADVQAATFTDEDEENTSWCGAGCKACGPSGTLFVNSRVDDLSCTPSFALGARTNECAWSDLKDAERKRFGSWSEDVGKREA